MGIKNIKDKTSEIFNRHHLETEKTRNTSIKHKLNLNSSSVKIEKVVKQKDEIYFLNNFEKTSKSFFKYNQHPLDNISDLFKEKIIDEVLRNFLISSKTFEYIVNTTTLSYSDCSTSTCVEELSENKINNNIINKKNTQINFNLNEFLIRYSYYTKLITNNTFTYNHKKYNNIFIFDWDDTLFPTYYITNKNNEKLSEEELNKIDKIEKIIIKIINKCKKYGHVFIITNSEKGWTESCVMKYFQESFSEILQKIDIISARYLYEEKFPFNKEKWKIETFFSLQNIFNYDNNVLTNIICIGDSHYEIEAGKLFAEKFNNSVIKTIKFKENPDLDELSKQLSLINEKMIRFINYPKSMSLQTG